VRGLRFAGSAEERRPLSESCGYLFHSGERFASYTGDWRGGTLLWTNLQGMHGPWTAIQQESQTDDVRVLDDGRIAKR